MAKSRAVLLGTNAFPFLIRYWYELFTRVWEPEVDKVYIAVSRAEHQSVWPYFKSMLNAHPKIEVFDTQTNWPASINQIAREIKEDLIWVPHDDTFVFRKGLLDGLFNIVEQTGKVVTPITPIFTPKDLVEELMMKKYPDQVPFGAETGEKGFSFYANMLFLPRELLWKTSIDFGEFHVPVGQYEPLLDWTPMNHTIDADTNFKFCLELLNAGAHFFTIDRTEIADLLHMEKPLTHLKKIHAPTIKTRGWLHLQTMAYHIYGLYYDLGEREAIEKIRGGELPPKIHEQEGSRKLESYRRAMTLRIAWIKEFMRTGDYSGIQKYYDYAKAQIDYIQYYLTLDRQVVDKFSQGFHNLIWKDEA